jgi:tetratricopeptide (TPR) repeat protein
MRKNLYSILVGATVLIFILILTFAKSEKQDIPSFKERTGSIALGGEWLNTKKAIIGLLADIELNPDNYEAKLNLARAYIQESRITGDHAYYDGAALDLLEDVIVSEPKNFDALCCKATVLLSQHHFSEALAIAKIALPINASSAFIYGIMCDAYVELGNYPEAVKMSDKMISLRPDIRSYARISYLREIHGDLNGAIQACKLAVAAGYPGLEETEWTRMILAHLHESAGHIDTAEYHYKLALVERPDYAYALAGLGKIEKSKNNYSMAIKYYEKANKMIIDYTFSDQLTDLYLLNNENEQSKKTAESVIKMLSPLSNENESGNTHGHYADKELAYAFLKTNDLEKALKHALLEYERRPKNIDVCETMAWVHYKNKKFTDANKFIDKALVTKSQNPVLLYRAGLIKINAGEKETGINLLRLASKNNPLIEDLELKNEVNNYLASL